eukprot:SAG11_NODE_32853_length_280_cov_0.861878_1_plen_41_part_01
MLEGDRSIPAVLLANKIDLLSVRSPAVVPPSPLPAPRGRES